MRQNISDTVRELSRTFARLFDDYRPELHYMRGPGPKCHAKRAKLAMPVPMAADARAARPARRDSAKARA